MLRYIYSISSLRATKKGQYILICRIFNAQNITWREDDNMARPKKSEDVIPARQRIKKAFWDMLPNSSVYEITVAMICTHAACNRSTFYRNYESVYDLLDEAKREAIPYELPIVIRDALIAGGDERTEAVRGFVVQNRTRLRHIGLLLSEHGDPGFARMLKDSMLEVWSQGFGASPESLGWQARTLMEFLLSGVVGILTYRDDAGKPVDLLQLVPYFSNEIAPVLIPLIERTLVADASGL
jgi:AcrR family transcriptional regulator